MERMELETEDFGNLRYFRSYTVSVWIIIPLSVLLTANFTLTILTLRAQKDLYYTMEDFKNLTLNAGADLYHACVEYNNI